MIGIVWGKTKARADNKLAQIVENYNWKGIKPVKIKNSNYISNFVEFDNGDTWKAVYASENARGNKCNISYIDKGIDIETIQTIIYPSTCCQPFQAFKFFWGE